MNEMITKAVRAAGVTEAQARAVILAIREPSDGMCLSGAVDYAVTSNTRRVWRGMIDVVLTGEPSELDRTGDPTPSPDLEAINGRLA